MAKSAGWTVNLAKKRYSPIAIAAARYCSKECAGRERIFCDCHPAEGWRQEVYLPGAEGANWLG